MASRIWISWNKQRRNIGLSKAFSAVLYMSELDLPRWLRMPLEFYRSWKLVRREKPTICFTMNPSIFSSWWLSKLARQYHFLLVTDLHTLNNNISGWFSKIFYHFFKSGIRDSDLVIVTNPIYKSQIIGINPSVVCIPDPLPFFQNTLLSKKSLTCTPSKFSVLLICSFGEDEPLTELLALDSQLDEFSILVSGNWKVKFSSLPATKNIRFLGYLPDSEYDSLLCSIDATMVLTTQEACLCCGAYEAYSAGKPLVLSGTKALRGFFGEAPIYTDNSSPSILKSLQAVKKEKDSRTQMIISGRDSLRTAFENGISEIENQLSIHLQQYQSRTGLS
jgi:glycosyltransferase involved in cell wall biosynthesis